MQFLKLAHNLLTKLRRFRPMFASFEPVRLLILMGVKPSSLITQRSVVQIHPPQPNGIIWLRDFDLDGFGFVWVQYRLPPLIADSLRGLLQPDWRLPFCPSP